MSLAVGSPTLMNHAVRALEARPELADLLVGVTGDFIPPRAVLSPAFVARLVASAWHAPAAAPSLRPIP